MVDCGLCVIFVVQKEKNRMEAITTWAKENYDLICLLVGVIGVIIAFISLIYEIKKRKAKKK